MNSLSQPLGACALIGIKLGLGLHNNLVERLSIKSAPCLKTSNLHNYEDHNTRKLLTHAGSPPDFMKYIVNTDAAVFSNTKAVGNGVVVHNHEGSVIAALSRRLPLSPGPLKAEVKAMDEVVSFARDIGLQDVIFKTYSTIINGALTSSSFH